MWPTWWKCWSIGRRDGRCARSHSAWGWDRNSVRKYITPAREAGYGPADGVPAEGGAAFVAQVCPTLGPARNNGLAWAELAARHAEIAKALKVNRPSTVWQRLHDEAGLQASLPSFRRYALATLPDAYARRPRITVGRDDPPPGEKARSITDGSGKSVDPVNG